MGNRTVPLCLFPKGTHPRPQPAQPVGGPLRAFRWEGRRPGTKAEVQRLTTSHQRRESRGKNLFPLGFFPPFLLKKWGPGWASHRSPPFQRRRGKTHHRLPRQTRRKIKPPVQESKPTQGVSSSQRSEGPAPPPRACPCSPHAQRRRPAHTAHGEAAGQSPGPRFG